MGNKLCIWRKKKTDGFWTNCGFENIRDYIRKKQKNHGVVASCVIGRKKLIGFGWTVNLKI